MIDVDWDKVKELRIQFEDARDEYQRAQKLANETQELASKASVKVNMLAGDLQALVTQ